MRKKYSNKAYLIILILLAAIIASSSSLFSWHLKYSYASAESRYAEIAMEVSTQKTLYDYNADDKLPMASTTKIMTALIIAEDCDPDQVVTVPDCAVGVEGSSIYLKKGEQIDIRDLLYGLMLRSGNDSAVALAVIHSGSVEKFIQKMNERAKELGAENTNFTNPNGLPDNNHYTTARDLAKITCAAMKNQLFKQIVGTKSWKGKFRTYSNKNKMLFNYEGATGVKTGYTVKAGRCLVSSAMREGMEVVCVVLNVYDMYVRSSQLLDLCFDKYFLVKLNENNIFMCNNVLCKIKNYSNILVKKDVPLTYKITPCDTQGKSNKKDEVVGKIEIYQENSLIFSDNLYSIV